MATPSPLYLVLAMRRLLPIAFFLYEAHQHHSPVSVIDRPDCLGFILLKINDPRSLLEQFCFCFVLCVCLYFFFVFLSSSILFASVFSRTSSLQCSTSNVVDSENRYSMPHFTALHDYKQTSVTTVHTSVRLHF